MDGALYKDLGTEWFLELANRLPSTRHASEFISSFLVLLISPRFQSIPLLHYSEWLTSVVEASSAGYDMEAHHIFETN